ncbi:uncharacterized protein VNE69_11041 [Vairimorpha necatrix]|uniref:Kinetochore protein SPC25 n=1 Tax=Vairimorpha necatrix TaxID=6039 RepID=A0AAX4JG06_9MICR
MDTDPINNYETIEHDMIHIKDYFKNYKFGIQERLSKLYFLNNLNTSKLNDTSDLLKNSKEKLVEIKNKGKECDQFIFDISSKLYNKSQEIKNEKKNLENLKILLKTKNQEFNDLNHKGDLFQIYETHNSKYKKVCNDIENVLNNIKKFKEELENKKKFNIEELEVYKNKLMSRTRRLSVIQYEKYIEDLYEFYKKMVSKIKGIFEIKIETRSEENKILVFVVNKEKNELKIEIVNGKIESIKGLGDEKKEEFYKKINDPRHVIYNFIYKAK